MQIRPSHMHRTLAVIATACSTMVPTPVYATPIDCAILLCMAGGFPASAECLAAKAEIIRRVTPVPIEPPLQIWRCPMGGATPVGVPRADIDISGPEFDFVRSIEVWDIYYVYIESGENNSCREVNNIRVGRYGSQGEFSWQASTPTDVPEWVGLDRKCPTGQRFRGVGYSFEDHEGNKDSKFIEY